MSTESQISGWLVGRLPADWFVAAPEVIVDRDEITIIGTLAAPEAIDGADPDEAAAGRIKRWREETRDQRIRIARELERKYERKVAWGAAIGEHRQTFTHLAIPAMTRLRQPERLVLDTLVDAGVARSRAEALAWCVRLVGQHEDDWLVSLREALASVDEVRGQGPS